MKSQKIRIYPTAKQRQTFRQWFGTARKVYNDTLDYLRQPDTVANWKAIKGARLAALPEWAKDIPYQVKSIAVRDACLAVSAAKRKALRGGKFQMCKFKTRRNPKQSCYIPASSVSAIGVYPRLSGVLKYAENVEKEHGDCRLICDKGRWFISAPVTRVKPTAENQGKLVSLDPGVRTFMTWFSEDGCGKIGSGAAGRIFRLCKHADDLIGKMTQVKHHQRQRMRQALNRAKWRIHDLLDDLHQKTALFFVKIFDVIALPTFQVSQMIRRGLRKIRSKTARAMLTLGHYRFRQIIKQKAIEFGKTVLDTNEAHTSKTVSWTGEVRSKLGGAKFIRSGDAVMDRDLNGARGIYLRALRDLSAVFRDGAILAEAVSVR